MMLKTATQFSLTVAVLWALSLADNSRFTHTEIIHLINNGKLLNLGGLFPALLLDYYTTTTSPTLSDGICSENASLFKC